MVSISDTLWNHSGYKKKKKISTRTRLHIPYWIMFAVLLHYKHLYLRVQQILSMRALSLSQIFENIGVPSCVCWRPKRRSFLCWISDLSFLEINRISMSWKIWCGIIPFRVVKLSTMYPSNPDWVVFITWRSLNPEVSLNCPSRANLNEQQLKWYQ